MITCNLPVNSPDNMKRWSLKNKVQLVRPNPGFPNHFPVQLSPES